MAPLSLDDISANAFRTLGLTAAASQAEIESAARKMRIWRDPSMIPATPNDAGWLGPVRRSRQELDKAVARLADPLTRLQERLWWFCGAPPTSDAPSEAPATDIVASHDAAIVQLYRGLLTNAASDDPALWEAVVTRFRALAKSDDYLQWLLEVESSGGFDKCATVDEIAEAQAQFLRRIASAATSSVREALKDGDYEAAAAAIGLAREDAVPAVSERTIGSRPPAPSAADELLDRMEDDLVQRCKEITLKIDKAWETKLVEPVKRSANHAVARFNSHIQPLIEQIVGLTSDVDRIDRVRGHGVELLLYVASAYEAFDNCMAAERVLETAGTLAGDGSIKYTVADRLEKARLYAKRQRSGVPIGQRQRATDAPAFKVKEGGPINEPSFISSIPVRAWIVAIIGVLILIRVGCSYRPPYHDNSAPTTLPIYDSKHPPPWVK